MERPLSALIRACHRPGGDLEVLRGTVLHELERFVPFEAAFLAAVDPETLVFTATFADEPLAEVGPLFLDNEFGARPDVNRFAHLARRRVAVSSLDEATGGERHASPRWTDIIAPLGLGDEARVALQVGGSTWGFLCLHRSGPRGFDRAEQEMLRRVGPHIAGAIRDATARGATAPVRRAPASGIVLVVGDRVASLGGGASEWLEELAGAPVTHGDFLPLVLLGAVRRLEALETLDPDQPGFSSRVISSGGALLGVRATRLHDARGSGPVALALEPATGRERGSLLLAAQGLTPAQRRVALLVLQGRTTRQIMVELRIAEHTVQDHLKAVFDKMGVRSRRDLVSAVMGQAA